MTHPGARHHDDAGPGEPGSPGQVQVFAKLVDGGAETPEGPEQVSPHQRGATWRHQHFPDGVVLFLVELARVHHILQDAHLVGGGAHGEQAIRVLPLRVLGTGDACIGAKRFLQEQAHRVRSEDHVVMAEEEV